MGYMDRIQNDLTAAMKEKNELRLSVLRMIKSALKLKEIDKMRPLDDMESLQVLQTLVKQRKESVEQFTQGGRQDLADKEAKEIKIIEQYLPAAPSDEEMRRAIEDAISESGADSLKQMGAVVKAARAKLEGKAVDGKVAQRQNPRAPDRKIRGQTVRSNCWVNSRALVCWGGSQTRPCIPIAICRESHRVAHRQAETFRLFTLN